MSCRTNTKLLGIKVRDPTPDFVFYFFYIFIIIFVLDSLEVKPLRTLQAVSPLGVLRSSAFSYVKQLISCILLAISNFMFVASRRKKLLVHYFVESNIT